MFNVVFIVEYFIVIPSENMKVIMNKILLLISMRISKERP